MSVMNQEGAPKPPFRRRRLVQMLAVYLALAVLIVAVLAGGAILYSERDNVAMEEYVMPKLEDITPEMWEALSTKTIYFAHQSVGYNIIDGAQAVAKDVDGLNLNLIETTATAELTNPFLVHSRVGRNCDPQSKIEGFRKILDEGLGDKVSIACVKLCYVDFDDNTDPDALFQEYKTVMDDLQTRYPGVRFLHITTPLHSRKPWLKAKVKWLIQRVRGRAAREVDNSQRHAYNELMRKAYGAEGGLFDLALIESIDPKGSRHFQTHYQTHIPLMYKGYSYDGGHLNEMGQRHAGAQFLIALARLVAA